MPIPVAVCVPIRNEEVELPGFLAAIEALDRDRCTFALCLFLDSCTDESAAVVARFQHAMPFRIVSAASTMTGAPNAGLARRAALAIGLSQLGGRDTGVLLSTDADSRPNPDWLQRAIDALGQADVAAGRIVRQPAHADCAQSRIEAYFDRLHASRRTIDPVPWDDPGGYHYTSAANLAITRSAYLAVGGFQSHAAGEDAQLIDDASRLGLRVRHDAAMVVATSSRRDGRALGGLATALADLDRFGPPLLSPPAAAIWQYERQGAARLAFARIGDAAARAAFGATIGLSSDHVLGVARDCPNAEAFAMRIVPTAPGDHKRVTLEEAMAQLFAIERRWLRTAA